MKKRHTSQENVLRLFGSIKENPGKNLAFHFQNLDMMACRAAYRYGDALAAGGFVEVTRNNAEGRKGFFYYPKVDEVDLNKLTIAPVKPVKGKEQVTVSDLKNLEAEVQAQKLGVKTIQVDQHKHEEQYWKDHFAAEARERKMSNDCTIPGEMLQHNTIEAVREQPKGVSLVIAGVSHTMEEAREVYDFLSKLFKE